MANSADILNNLPETAEYFQMKDEVDKAVAFADLLTTTDEDGKVGELTSMTAVFNVSFNDGTSTRIHTSAEFNKYFIELVKANASEFFTRTKMKANELLAVELAEAEAEVGGKLPGAGTPPAPVIDGKLGASAQEGVAFSYTPTAANLSGAASITWSATGLPASLTINPLTGAITGTPVTDDVGTHDVVLNVTTNIGNDDATLVLVIQAA